MIRCPFYTRLLRGRAEDLCNPRLHIKDRPDIWTAISRVAGCHLPRCLACGLQLCQMGIMRPQDAFQEAPGAPKTSRASRQSFSYFYFLSKFHIFYDNLGALAHFPDVYAIQGQFKCYIEHLSKCHFNTLQAHGLRRP